MSEALSPVRLTKTAADRVSVRAGDAPGSARAGDVPGKASSTAERRPALDGLRALAVMSVMAYHFGGGSSSVLPGGFLGVDVFFVLSGYLITGLLLAEIRRTGRIDLVGFWARRVRRLLPAAALMILAVSAYVWWAVPPQNWPARRGDLLATIGYAANWHFLATGEDYFAAYAGASPLRHAWSLAIEEQFYAVWPGAVLFVAWAWWRLVGRGPAGAGSTSGEEGAVAGSGCPSIRWRRGWAVVVGALVLLIGASALAMAVQFRQGDPVRAYYGTDGRAQELLIGALGALILPRLARRTRSRTRSRNRTRTRTRAAGLALAAAGLVPTSLARRTRAVNLALAAAGLAILFAGFLLLHDGSAAYYRGGALMASLATLALLAGVEGHPGCAMARALSWGPAVALGRISYGMYLWHWPVGLAWQVPPGADWQQAARVQAGRVLATVLIAAASSRWIEQPVLRGRLAWVRRSRTRLAVAAMGTAGLLVVCATAATALPAGLGEQLADSADRPCPNETSTDLRMCLHGAGPGAPEAMLLGDSTARALAPGLDVAMAAHGRAWVQAAWKRCTPTGLMVVPNGMDEPDTPARACAAQARDRVSEAVARYRPRLVLITEFWSHHQALLVDGRFLRPGTAEHAAALRSAYADLTAHLVATGAEVVFIDLPPPGKSLGPAVAAGRPAGREMMAPGGAYVAGFNAVVHSVVAQDPRRAAVISVDDLFCPDATCAALQHRRLVRVDGVHITADFSRRIGPEVLRRAEAAAASL